MGVVGVMEWSIYDGLGVVWRVLIIPAYVVLLGAAVVGHALGTWAALPAMVLLVAVPDLVLYRLRRAKRTQTQRRLW